MSGLPQDKVLRLCVQKIAGLKFDLASTNEVYLFLGEPSSNLPNCFIAVMGQKGDETDGTAEWRYIGDRSRTEKYKIVVHVSVWIGGAEKGDESEAQVFALQDAATMVEAIDAAFIDDANLANENNGEAAVVWIIPGAKSYALTEPEDETPKGRFANCKLTLQVFNVLAP